MKTKVELTQLFLLACSNAKPEDFSVFRYNIENRDVKFGKQTLRIVERPGKNTLICIEEDKPINQAIHNCELSDPEHEQLKNIWERAAQVKYVIRWWKKIENYVPPQIRTPYDLGDVEQFFLKEFTVLVIEWTKDVTEAKKFSKEDVER
jgi:hypothetical protein